MLTADSCRPQVAVLPAAGLGTRMRGVDPLLPPNLPKELYPVAGLPAIHHALMLAIDAGIPHAVVVVREDKHALRRVLADPWTAMAAYPQSAEVSAAIARQLTVHVCFQDSPRGECDALAAAWPVTKGLAQEQPVTVVYPDNLVFPGPHRNVPLLLRLAAAVQQTGRETVALMPTGAEPRDDISDSGRVNLAPWVDDDPEHSMDEALSGLHSITGFLPKGPGMFTPRFPDELRTCGIYAATARWFEAIESALSDGLPAAGTELTDGVVRRRMLDAGAVFAGLETGADVLDIGNPAGYRRAVSLLGRGECRPERLTAAGA
ncbi:NTP transferase domain-containing protein [Oceanidesulfovibrio marinus]|uniref:UTP--glucose-1-phosphate uridylyltransferase n=1 Tax=Oceanidesulfovibrio marinus TaxID=370038 RepID=A0ABX6NDG5_9BACT|nr:NTP transferase domain-containing protein [Oceanidesulfovibrio marinus]QJT08643.1 hypothetical protein E8L03_06765 [Oceanidesulfovibrio marinus]